MAGPSTSSGASSSTGDTSSAVLAAGFVTSLAPMTMAISQVANSSLMSSNLHEDLNDVQIKQTKDYFPGFIDKMERLYGIK